ncbi:hypothetical protein DYB37_005928 [Aphanomyces astaci]|nr:hypothetical protein DYB36_005496 [Aphanomyces astaci]RHY17150.1 hypothetical protein DYB25_007111 [Aphanomyces astaci]RHY38610.1 hypothetical protein DYB38_005468 [Aphanomyces astaci]RHY42617.1 hypothetical protein DYB30_002664 [Aphanomyces astaci]RHY52066.1 hypothetical protein DYB34_003494 [Aphanomyces astaci]
MLRYTYVDGMLDKRGPFRGDHLHHVETYSADTHYPKVILGGAFADPVDGAAFVIDAADAAQVEAFAKSDPYVINKLVTKFDVRPYNVVTFTK